MSVSILGAGNVGIALATAFTRKGESVVLGVPNPGKYQRVVDSLGHLASLTDVASAIAASDVVVLAVPYQAALAIAASMADWQDKILVDATNPLATGLTGLMLGTTESGAEAIAAAAVGARVVKAFNTTGAENMLDSHYAGGQPWMPVCGNDEDACQRVVALASLIGFDAVAVGDLSAARYLEPFAMTWIHMAIKRGFGRRFAFSIVRR